MIERIRVTISLSIYTKITENLNTTIATATTARWPTNALNESQQNDPASDVLQ